MVIDFYGIRVQGCERAIPTVIWKTFTKSIFLALAVWVTITATQAAAGSLPSIAFYYADHVPVRQLVQFDRIVVEADHVDAAGLTELESYGGRAYAYVLPIWRILNIGNFC